MVFLKNIQSKRGTALIVTLMVLLTISAQVMVLFIILNRGLGEESKLQSLNIEARNGIDTYMTRLESSLSGYLQSNPASGVAAAYGSGGSPLMNQTLQIIDPENVPGGLQNTEVTVDAYVSDATRPPYYRLTVNAKVGKVDLTEHKWVRMNPCGSGTLVELINSASQAWPGASSSMVDTTGRVYWGNSGASGEFWTWKNSTGLSAISSGVGIGSSSSIIDSLDRVYYGGGSEFFTWKDGSGLSAIVGGQTSVGYISTMVDDSGRLFFGNHSGANDTYWTWKDGSSLSAIVSGKTSPGYYTGIVHKSSGRVFFGNNTGISDEFWTWQDGSGLSVIVSGKNRPGWDQKGISSSGRVFFGNRDNTTGEFWTWTEGSGLSVIVSGQNKPGFVSTHVDSTNRVYFGNWTNVNDEYWTWKDGSGLSALVSGLKRPGYANTSMVDNNDRVYFGNSWVNTEYWTWKDGSGLSALVSGQSWAGNYSVNYTPFGSGRAFFGTGDVFWTWNSTSGTSALISGIPSAGSYASATDNTGRVYFSGNDFFPLYDTFWMWKDGDGLSAIASGLANPGYNRSTVVDKVWTRVFFGNMSQPPGDDGYYYWQSNSCDTR